MSVKQVEEYIQKTLRKREIETQLNALKEEIARDERELCDYFASESLQNIKTASGQAYLSREIFASLIKGDDGTYTKAHAALRRNGLKHLVKGHVYPQSLTSYVREQEELEQPLPKTLLKHFNIAEVFRIRVRSS